MARLKLYLSYDGTYYQGWQRQKNTSNTIQEIVETKLSTIADRRVSVVASGRTDAGVHARVQVAHADVPDRTMAMLEPIAEPDGRPRDWRLKQALNSMLPPDIRVLLIEPAAQEFHAQKHVRRKTYVFFIDPSTVQFPELRNHAWNLRLPLDWDAMLEATRPLVGTHDFRAFCAADAAPGPTTRTIFEAEWGEAALRGFAGDTRLMALRLTGSGFLKSMVRSIVGTLVKIGGGKAEPALVERLLAEGSRNLAGPTAPARGLWLWDILY